jgi:hypothetical protein
MSIPKNEKLYETVKEEAKKRFKRYPSLYASSWIVKEYKSRGGKYYGTKNEEGISQWYKEKWVMVIPFVKSGKVVECGESVKDTKACRPIKRVNKKTPITLPELLDKHTKKDILEMARKKNKNMKKRVNWEKLEFY